MTMPIQITFRDMDPSPALEAKIRMAAAKLEERFGRATACRVVVEAPHKHQHQGRLFHVSVDVAVPGHQIAVGRNHADRVSHESPYVAVRDAFRAAHHALSRPARSGSASRGDARAPRPWGRPG
jgi:hypothetical protein